MTDFDFSVRAADLKRQFDASFAALPDRVRESTEDFLAIRVARDPFAIRVGDLARLGSAPRIIRVPTRRTSVLGVAAIRGVLVSVHSLALLLGYDAHEPSARWIALSRALPSVGFAFGELERFVRVSSGAASVLAEDGVLRPIVDVGVLVQSIKKGDVQ